MSPQAEIYGYTALMLLIISLFRGTSRQGSVSFLILLAWCVNVPLSISLLGHQADVGFLIIEDIALGLFIVWGARFASDKAKFWQILVGAWFVLMLANHVIYLATLYSVTDEWAIYYIEYAWWLGKTAFAWLQLLTLALWIGKDIVGNLNFNKDLSLNSNGYRGGNHNHNPSRRIRT